jgi:hypothetical protein
MSDSWKSIYKYFPRKTLIRRHNKKQTSRYPAQGPLMPTRTHETGRVSTIARVKRARGKKNVYMPQSNMIGSAPIKFSNMLGTVRTNSKRYFSIRLIRKSNARTIGGIRSEPEGTEEPSARETPDIARCTPAGPLIPLERGALFYVR